jgi:hypothetical protein
MDMKQVRDNCFAALNEKNRVCQATRASSTWAEAW